MAVTDETNCIEEPRPQRFRPYPKYKESHIKWLGHMPSHWNVKRLRATVAGCQNGVWGEEADEVNDVVCIRVADFDRIHFRVCLDRPTMRSIEPTIAQSRQLEKGDLLLEKSGGGDKQPVGAVAIYDHGETAVCSNFIARMPVADGYHARYLTYLHATLYAARINVQSIKQSTGIQNLDSDAYLNESVALPTLIEQRTIADFLDRETAKIDALVAKKNQFIELLQAKRTALITSAVTRGLDPRVHMKDSGVGWLGHIPAHWEATRLWRFGTMRSGATPSKENASYWNGEVPWVSPKDMKRRVITSSEDTITEQALDETGIELFGPQVVLVVVRGMILAHSFPVAVAAVPVTINQDMKAITLNHSVEPFYFAWALEGLARGIVATVVEEAAHGTRVIRMDHWRNLVVPLPSRTEQCAIVEFLDDETSRIDSLIDKILQAVNQLRELRVSLISSTVTGKIDVREEE